MPEFRSFDGCRISYEDVGDGPVVVLLHGFIVDSTLNWSSTGLTAALVDSGYRVVVPDARGHGASEKPTEPAAYADDVLVKDVSSLLDCLGVDRVALVGYSMGADTAIRVAASDGRVRAVVAGGVGGDLGDPADLDRPSVARAIRRGESGMAAPEPLADLATALGGDAMALAALFEGVGRQVPPDFGSVTCPCLVIRGDQDDMSGGTAEALAELLPQGQALTLRALDHLETVFDPHFADGMATFLEAAYPAP